MKYIFDKRKKQTTLCYIVIGYEDTSIGIHNSHIQSEEITQRPADSQNHAPVGP